MTALSTIQAAVSVLADRSIPNAPFLLAVQDRINDIERRDQRIIRTSFVLEPLDGSSVYDLSGLSVAREQVIRIGYIPTEGPAVQLVEQPSMMPPTPITGPRPNMKVRNYMWLSASVLQLDSWASTGNLRIETRDYGGTPVLGGAGAGQYNDCAYAALQAGLLAYFGQYVWGDSRAKDWADMYEKAIKAELATVINRVSDLGNLGSSNMALP